MGCSQHEVHTTLICTCRDAALQVFSRHVQMCTLTPPLEYKLPKGKTRALWLLPSSGPVLCTGQSESSSLNLLFSERNRDGDVQSTQHWKGCEEHWRASLSSPGWSDCACQRRAQMAPLPAVSYRGKRNCRW